MIIFIRMKEKKVPRRFNKAQVESIRNSPMFVKKRAEAEAAFASPSYKALAKKKARNRKK